MLALVPRLKGQQRDFWVNILLLSLLPQIHPPPPQQKQLRSGSKALFIDHPHCSREWEMAKNNKNTSTTLHLMSVCRKYLIFKELFMGVFGRKTQTLLLTSMHVKTVYRNNFNIELYCSKRFLIINMLFKLSLQGKSERPQ